ncbi:MAG: hypothetical protein RLZZ46_303 [Bacteroidota bacterium]|jgi:transcriptional regulator with XRE-family HTH domain
MSHIGLKIRKFREHKGLTQKQLADSIYKTRPLITQIEQTGMVNQITLNSILKALGLDYETLNSGTPDLGILPQEIKEELIRLRSENLFLRSELDSVRELSKTQKRLIAMLESK